ncbi:MAG: UDP-N-acetylmuramoyl-L-alanyl-D-glutamate--2,6-diaminopimelate ligase [Anaerolineales bacterium]|jgi:UDP-N-acetylmuramoyl-L-alanyl-D-glutamate--2,6-diaminopimelate ligase|nr:UDP-N-acetylmuramoyl-L-alanyl-D-glutamate--2,6-diaminopimelate ligase [Anaerolineales bacterium]
MTTQKLLSDLFAEFPFPYSGNFSPDPSISGIAIDSRTVRPGDLFFAMPGGSQDGHKFIPAAIAKGAAAIVGQQQVDGLAVPYIRVENARRAVTYLASAFYDYPGRKLTVIGVTGTDGKTTTSNLLYHILIAAGFKAGIISTVNAVIGGEELDTGFHVTTPDAPDVQRYLSKMVAAGLTHVVLETTSHGLAQYRADASQYDIAIVTNITHEHLDQHGSYENYRAAKGRLFELLAATVEKKQGNPRLAVLNFDDKKSYGYLRELTETAQVSYGLTRAAGIYAKNIRYRPSGSIFDIVGPGFVVRSASSNLVGAYNISNCLAAFSAAVIGLNVDPRVAAQGLSALQGIPGRMEAIDLGQNFSAIVDFAHTPNALKVTLEQARQMTSGRVIAVFGSAGLRDREKRRMMAETAAQLADISVLTAEDPRTESLDGILGEMAAGAESQGGREGESFYRVPDRGEAIRFAIRLARPGDLVVACGKGHEQSMCFDVTEYLWDDRTAMRAALAEFLGVAGPEMPYLPTQSG